MDALQGVFQSLPFDYVILGGIALFVALDALRSGLGRGVSLAVALPLAAFFFSFAHTTAGIGPMLSSPLFEVGAFGVLVALAYFFARRIGLEFVDGGIGQPLQAAIAGTAVTAITLVIWLSTPGLENYWLFNEQIQMVFAEQFRLFWLLGSYAAFAFARG